MAQANNFVGMVPVKSHEGHILLKVAGTYVSLADALLEMIQNGLDVQASAIWIDIDQKLRRITVRDNGEGVTDEKFQLALRSVGVSIKTKDKMGRFGLGLISPLGKCESYTFTSCGDGKANYLCWTFVTKDIKEVGENLTIPCHRKEGLRFDSKAKFGQSGVVPWRTQITITKYTKDRQLSCIDLDALEAKILSRFSEAMRSNTQSTIIHVSIKDAGGIVETREITARDFLGEQLEEVVYDSKAGATKFQLFIALKQKGVRTGGINIGEIGDLFRIAFKDLAGTMSALREWVQPECLEAMLSGFFEGNITSSKLVLLDSRDAYQVNDGFVEFCGDLEDWWQTIGQTRYDTARESAREHRYTELGRKAQALIRAMLEQNPALLVMTDLATESFQYGSVGRGHKSPDKTVGETDQPGTALDGSQKPTQKDEPTVHLDEPENDKPKHAPWVVMGNEGSRRKQVKGDSQGFHFAYEEMPDSLALWSMDMALGKLTFNIRHWIWSSCEQKDRALIRLHMIVYVMALVWCNTSVEQRDIIRTSLDSMVEAYSYVLANDEKLMMMASKFLPVAKASSTNESVVSATGTKSTHATGKTVTHQKSSELLAG